MLPAMNCLAKTRRSGIYNLPAGCEPELCYRRGVSECSFLGGNNISLDGGTYHLDSFVTDSNSTITIDSDVVIYVDGDFSMNSNSRMNIEGDGSLTLLVGGSLRTESNTSINNYSDDRSARNLNLVVTGGGPVQLVPTATRSSDLCPMHFEHGQQCRDHGAVVAGRAVVAQCQFHRDIRLEE